MAETKWFKFGKGLAQRTDDRLLEPGVPRRIENLIQVKDGRLEMRKDYDALAMTTQPGTTLTLFDIHSYQDRLIGLGQIDKTPAVSPKAPIDVIEFANMPLYGWRGTNPAREPRLSLATNMRNLARVGVQREGNDEVDVAAGGGLVCTVWLSSQGNIVNVLVTDADTDAVVLYTAVAGELFARVVCTGTIFFIVTTIGLDINIHRYNPASDTTTVLLAVPNAATTAFLCLDVTLANEGTTFWLAYGRAAGFRVHGFNASGTETHDFAGAAVVCDFIGVFTEAVSSGVQRVHVCAVIDATAVVDMYTYTASTSLLQTATPNIFATTAVSQPSMCIRSSTAGRIITIFQTGLNVVTGEFTNSTHAVTAPLMRFDNAVLNGKIANINGRAFAAVTLRETVSTTDLTHMMVNFSRELDRATIPCLAIDRLISLASDAGHFPNLATDTSTGKSYWCRLLFTGQFINTLPVPVPITSELDFCSTARRQLAQVGNIIYLAGGAIQYYDGRGVAEASFLDRPRIISLSGAILGGGALAALGTYQMVFVYEMIDGQGNRVQSAPSDVVEVTLTGAQQAVTAVVTSMHSFHKVLGFDQITGLALLVGYRTLNTAGGNLTFHRDGPAIDNPFANMGVSVTISSTRSDADLSDEEILYTQGSRGSLSGPLPFLAPVPAISIVASADRVLTAGLADISRIQESRIHIESEQVNWSDSIGFQRDARGRVLAVARLDERRIIFTATELFEMDGPGLDDNGNGDIGAPRRLPSDVGLYGGELGWRSMVECSIGILFQGLADMIYLLPRGGTTPVPIGIVVRTLLASFPTITAAVYLAEDQTVRFTCNNLAATDAISLLYDVIENEWFQEGPYGTTVTAASKLGGRICLLRNNVVFQQRATHPPATFINNAWGSGTIHPFGPEQWGRVYAFHFYGEYRGDCQLACIIRWDDLVTETLAPVGVGGLTVGDPYSHKFTANQVKCESFRVDYQVTMPALQIVTSASQAFTGNNVMNVTLPASRQIGDRIVVGISVQVLSGGNPISTPTGWRQVGTTALAQLRTEIYDRTLDGTEQDSVVFVMLNSGAGALTRLWLIRGQHSNQLTEAVSATNASSSATTLDIGNLTPTWGSAANLWLIFMGIASENTPPQITVFPTGFINTGELQNVSASALIDGTIGFCDQILTAAALNPTAFTYTRDGVSNSSSAGFIMAIRPAVVSEGLVYHHWGYDSDPAGKSALKGPSQMS